MQVNTQTYTTQPWFALLKAAAETMQRKALAQLLGVSAPQISQVLNGTGRYGSGQASTQKLAAKVLHNLGRYECPHLSEQQGSSIVIDASACRGFAHRKAPTGSPRDMQHWQACNTCPHKAHTAAPQARAVVPRKQKNVS